MKVGERHYIAKQDETMMATRTYRRIIPFLIGSVIAAVQPAPCVAGTIVRASEIGAHLDSDLMEGGGTDDTSVLQHALNSAGPSRPVHLVIDGAALVSGLNVYSYTTIECTAGGGLFLKDNSSRAILRNAHRSRGTILDEHIVVKGCFLNGNRDHQPYAHLPYPEPIGYALPSNREADGTFISGLQFLGVNYLSIENVTLWSIRAFGALIGNANYVDIRSVVVDDGGGVNPDPVKYVVTDGLHFKGPLHYVSIEAVKFRGGDDALAFNANDFDTDDITKRNDFGPYVGQGPITDVTVSNVIFMPGQFSGIRIFSTTERIDRVLITNVTGTVRSSFLTVSHWMNPRSFGNVGNIQISNVSVERNRDHSAANSDYTSHKMSGSSADDGEHDPFIYLNGNVESMRLNGIATSTPDPRPILQIGPEAKIGTLDADLTVEDPDSMGNVLDTFKGSRVTRMKVSLAQNGPVADEGRAPFLVKDGIIDTLIWRDTPPLFVGAYRPKDVSSFIDVTFNQELKAGVTVAGANIRTRDGSVVLASAVLRQDGRTIRYVLGSPLPVNDEVRWSYDSATGNLQSMDGESLRSVGDKIVQRRALSN